MEDQKKSNQKMILIAAIVAVIVIVALVAVLLLNNGGGGGGGDTTLNWDPSVGDYLEYTVSGFMAMTMRQTVISETATTYTINQTATVMGQTSYQELIVDKATAFSGTYDPQAPPAGWTVNHIGTQSLSTNWGQKACDKWTMTGTSEGQSFTVAIWLKGGVMMKSEVVVPDFTMTMILTGTNVSAIINS